MANGLTSRMVSDNFFGPLFYTSCPLCGRECRIHTMDFKARIQIYCKCGAQVYCHKEESQKLLMAKARKAD